jgi:NAD(P)-dependent dehydrogenase (short-subunit alcohol dehydrogenase family)
MDIEASGSTARAVPSDIADQPLPDRFGRIDILINHASFMCQFDLQYSPPNVCLCCLLWNEADGG